MTIEEESLIAAILADPADDHPRLVYADWLTENGKEGWGDLIRVQIQIAIETSEWPTLPRQPSLRTMGAMAIPLVGAHISQRIMRRYNRQLNDWVERRQRILALRQRESDLLDKFGYFVVNTPKVWPVGVTIGAIDTGDGMGRLSISRGFVEWWRMSSKSWLDHGDEILTRHPLRLVKFNDDPAGTGRLNDFGLWKRTGPEGPWSSLRWKSVQFEYPERSL